MSTITNVRVFPNSTIHEPEEKTGDHADSRLTIGDDAGYPMSETEDMTRSDHADSQESFYRTAFWWMMGLGASAIVGTFGSVLAFWVTTSNALARMEVNYANLRDSQDKISSYVEKSTVDRYTSTSAAVDKADYISRLSKHADMIDTLRNEIIELKLWKAANEAKNGGRP